MRLTSITNLNPVPQTIDASVFELVTIANITLLVPASSISAYQSAAVWRDFKAVFDESSLTTSVASHDRVVPAIPDAKAVVVAPSAGAAGEFAAGPNPVARNAGKVGFFRQGKRVDNATLTVYDAAGNVVTKVKVSDKALGSQDRRQVGSWNLKDDKGRLVPEGTYLVRGVVKTADGKKERWSAVVGVR
jgi:hypothetical protein